MGGVVAHESFLNLSAFLDVNGILEFIQFNKIGLSVIIIEFLKHLIFMKQTP